LTFDKGQKAAGTTAVIEDGAVGASALPERKYFRIGEVAEIVGVEPHVLRYWETQFSQLRPHKARSGHRLYRRREVETLLVIKDLLHVQRFTIAGARLALRQGSTSSPPRAAEQLTLPPAPGVTARHARVLESTLPTTVEVEDDGDGDLDDEFDDEPGDTPGDEALVDGEAESTGNEGGDGTGAVGGTDGDDVADEEADEDEDDDELELHLAGPLPTRVAETAISVEARDGDELATALEQQLADQLAAPTTARRGRTFVAVEVRTGAQARRRARRLLRHAARELEALLGELRRSRPD
jgi:DNA-binding transcriptional MerR regulator